MVCSLVLLHLYLCLIVLLICFTGSGFLLQRTIFHYMSSLFEDTIMFLVHDNHFCYVRRHIQFFFLFVPCISLSDKYSFGCFQHLTVYQRNISRFLGACNYFWNVLWCFCNLRKRNGPEKKTLFKLANHISRVSIDHFKYIEHFFIWKQNPDYYTIYSYTVNL